MNDSHEPPPDDRALAARAAGLASNVTAIALEMALPALLGYWIDTQVDTGVLFTLIGVVLGLVTGFWHLAALVRQLSSENTDRASAETAHRPKREDEDNDPAAK